MGVHHTLIVAAFIAGLAACTDIHDRARRAESAPQPRSVAAPAIETPPALASFARMVSGEWKVTSAAGTSLYDTWYWGPGKQSLRVMTDGVSAAGDPWRELGAVYWHPGRREVCLFGLNPFERSVAEGTAKFDGEAAEAVFDLYQTGVRRRIARRWTFDGPDRYHSALLEDSGAGYTLLAEWDYVRTKPHDAVRSRIADHPSFPDRLRVLEPLVGGPWESMAAAGVNSTEVRFRASVEWVPYAGGIYARVHALQGQGDPEHLFDVYIYHHTGKGVLHCLALSARGSVYEGDFTMLDGGGLQLELKGYEGDRVAPYRMRLDVEGDQGTRGRVWSLEGAQPVIVLDLPFRKPKPAPDTDH